MISDAIRRQFGKFTNFSRPDIVAGQTIIIPGKKSSEKINMIVDAVYDYNNLAEEKIIIICHRDDNPDPNEWMLADCQNEYGSPVLTNVQILTCRQNFTHFIKRRQIENYEKFQRLFSDAAELGSE
ncbi:MAG: hypothetical protein FWE54_01630 [Methanimicrococcus sp.]|nr:hypothetical protein [Methanimicrococcus sp.]